MPALRFVALFYALMGGLGWALARYWAGVDPWEWPQRAHDPVRAVLWGAGVGLVAVALSNVLERHAAWASRLSDAFRETLGPLSHTQCFGIAVCSALGEELLFRGFVLQGVALRVFDPESAWGFPVALLCSSLIFGGLHIGPDWRTFLPWTLMAITMGGVFGALFWWTGGLEAPIIAHFTINFLNLIALSSREDA